MRFMSCLCCIMVFCIALLGSVSHGQLDDLEKAALAELFYTFPNLGSIPTSEYVEDGNVDYGRSWTNNFDTLCLNGDGYEYYGLYCSNGHITGIVLTQAWEPGILGNFSSIEGLSHLKNVTAKTSTTLVETLVFRIISAIEIEWLYCSSPSGPLYLTTSLFGHPTSLRYLHATFSLWDPTPFSNLLSVEVIIVIPYAFGVWSTSLESVQISRWPIHYYDLFELATNLTSIKFLGTALLHDTESILTGNGTFVSESIETLELTLDFEQDYIFTVNSSSLKTAGISTNKAPLVLNTPNIQKLDLYTFDSIPPGFTELKHLEELTMDTVNISATGVFNFSFAVNLTSLTLKSWIVEPSVLSSLLCNLVTNNPRLSSLTLSNLKASIQGTVFELPTCLKHAGRLKSVYVSGYALGPADYPFHAASVMTNLPPTLDYLTIYQVLDNDTHIYNFTQFGQLKELHLRDDHLVGEMRNDFLSFFPHLEVLFLQSQSINGIVPSVGWVNLRRIELWCNFEQWTGIDSAPFLEYVDISSDALETMPKDIDLVSLRELEYFVVAPSVGARIPTPSFWTRLPKLTYISIVNVNFLGPMTSNIAAPRLRTLRLGNSICGSLPDFASPMTLDQLYFSNNQFSGTIPQSWATNLSIRSTIYLDSNKLSGTIPSGFLNNKTMLGFYESSLIDNYFSGPVWNFSQNRPSRILLSNNNFNICETLSLPAWPIFSCQFLNVSVCPDASNSECNSFWNSSCQYFECSTHSVSRIIPPIDECIAPFNQCPPPGPPGFRCINGQWISDGSVSVPSITLPSNAGVIVVFGNLSTNGPLTFDGTGTSIVVEGCVQNLPTQVTIVLKGDEKLKTTNLLTQKGSDCPMDLSLIPVDLVQDKNNCKQVKYSTKGSTRSTLLVAFEIDSHKCNVKWIILGSVLGGIVILGAVGLALAYHFSPRFRSFVLHCKTKKESMKLEKIN